MHGPTSFAFDFKIAFDEKGDTFLMNTNGDVKE
jgi:hypothetical protein